MKNQYPLPATFSIRFYKTDGHIYLLSTSQILNIPVEKAFSFFEKPENLPEITPDWLKFSFDNKGGKSKTYQGAEFDYTITWLGIRIKWHTKILEFRRPEMFIDMQLKGPYSLWKHLHTFESIPDGTLIRDFVTYRIPFSFVGKILFGAIIRRQLQDIFSYRAVRIAQWADGTLHRKD